VTGHSCSALALIVDHDLGFVMWLGEIFAEVGCQAAPAFNCRQALALIQQIDLPIATLIINPQLRGAKRLVKMLTASNPDLRLVLIRDAAAPENDAHRRGLPANPGRIQARFTLQRPAPAEPISRTDWAARIRKMLS
jgi:hypothetical protein